MRFLLLFFLFSCGSLSAFGQTANPREFEMKDGDTTYIMKKYWFVMLVRGDQATTFTKPQLDSLQKGHMENIGRMADTGKLIMAGPFGDDGEWRGIFVFDCDTEEEVKELMKGDPAITAGRLKPVIHPWWAAKGTVLK